MTTDIYDKDGLTITRYTGPDDSRSVSRQRLQITQRFKKLRPLQWHSQYIDDISASDAILLAKILTGWARTTIADKRLLRRPGCIGCDSSCGVNDCAICDGHVLCPRCEAVYR